jgi:hypothetical protein
MRTDNVVDSLVDHHAAAEVGLSSQALYETRTVHRRGKREVRPANEVTTAEVSQRQVRSSIRGPDAKASYEECNRLTSLVEKSAILIGNALE